MHSDAIAFTIRNDGSKTVRPDAVNLFDDGAAILFHLRDRVAYTAVGVQVDQNASGGSN